MHPNTVANHILEMLQDGPKTPWDVAVHLHCGVNVTRKAIELLMDLEQVDQYYEEERCYLRLKKPAQG